MPDTSFLNDAESGIFVGHEPSWLVRSGISLVAGVLVLGLAFAALIRYPDVIHAPVVLTTGEPPAEVVSRIDGRIEHLLVEDAQAVTRDQPLVWLASDVDLDQLDRLENAIANLRRTLERGSPEGLDAEAFEIGGLGQLQLPCNQLALALRELRSFFDSPRDATEDHHAEAQRRRVVALQQQLAQKRSSYERKLEMQQELLDGSRELAAQGLLPKAQLATLESRLLDQRLALDDLEIQAETYDMQLQDIDFRRRREQIGRNEAEQHLSGEVRHRLRELTSALARWRRSYLLTAPADGHVTLTRFGAAHQEVKRGEAVLIVSHDRGRRLGRLSVSQSGAGKIQVGQRVDIQLHSFPAVEFGSIEAVVASVALVPGELAPGGANEAGKGYRVDVELPEPFITTHGHRLPFTPNAAGTARIITEDRRLLGRLFNKLLYLLQQNGR